LGSRRVTESLRAIASYLDEGAKIARGVPSGQVLPLNPVDVPSTLSPRLAEVVWVDTGTRTISVGPGNVQRELLARGENLHDVAVLKLLSTKGGRTFETIQIVRQDPESSVEFTATVDLSDPKRGSYHALVATVEGDTFFSPRKLKIKSLPELPEEPGPEIQLGELAPNVGNTGETVNVTLTLLRGTAQDIDDIYLVDLDGHSFDWVEIVQNAAALRARRQRNAGLAFVDLTITVPGYADVGPYCLVVTSPNSESEDRLVFHVVQEIPGPMLQQAENQPVPPPAAQAKAKPDPQPDPQPAPESKSKSQSR
jgi:hypothetical protein